MLLQACGSFEQPLEMEIGENKAAAVSLINARHKAWILKRCAEGQKLAWRPRKRYRTAAVKFIMATDNQLNVSTAWTGLQAFMPIEGDPLWAEANWRSWPYLSLALDQGTDGVCGWHALAYKENLALNTGAWWDWSHGACNDMELAYKAVGKFPFILLTMVAHNIQHGPEKDEGLRFRQLQESVQFLFQNFSADTCALFQSHAPAILEEMGDQLPAGSSGHTTQDLWMFLQEAAPFEKKDYKVNFCRFMAYIRASRKLLPSWTLLLFKCEFLALELDLLQGRSLKEKLLLKQNLVRDAEEQATTSTEVTQVDVKLLRSCCQNAVVICVMLLGVPFYRRVMAVLTHVPTPLDAWHGHANSACRDVSATSEWLLEQLAGGFMQHLFRIIATLSDPTVLKDCGFFLFEGAGPEDQDAYTMVDEELAGLMGCLVLQLLAARQRRVMYFLGGWPGKLFKVLLGPAMARATLAEFKRDHAVWKHLRSLSPLPAGLSLALDRSVFKLTAVKQLVAACEESGWEPSGDMEELLRERTQAIIGTQLVEDIFGLQKNSKQVRGSKRFRKCECSMMAPLAGHVLDERHRYKSLAVDEPIARKTLKLDHSAFGKGGGEHLRSSIPLHGISSTVQKASFFSPRAEAVGLPAADLTLLQYCHDLNLGDKISNAKLGSFCNASFKLIFRRVSPAGQEFGWHVGLWHFPRSSIMAWPVELLQVPGYVGSTFAKLCLETNEPRLLPVLAWEGIEGWEYNWGSWSWQCCHFPLATPQWRPCVRMFLKGDADTLEVIAARSAFWTLDLASLMDVAGHLGAPVPSGSSLLDSLLIMIRHVLQNTEEEAMGIIAQRLVALDGGQECVQELLEVEEAAKLLTNEDEKVLKQEQEAGQERRNRYQAFAAEYSEKKRAARAAAEAASSSSRARGRPKGAAKAAPRQLPAKMSIAMSQAEAKEWMPPGSYIWKSSRDASWFGRLPPFNRVARSWRKYGEHQALRLVVSAVWHQWMDYHGVSGEDCPVKDLIARSEC